MAGARLAPAIRGGLGAVRALRLECRLDLGGVEPELLGERGGQLVASITLVAMRSVKRGLRLVLRDPELRGERLGERRLVRFGGPLLRRRAARGRRGGAVGIQDRLHVGGGLAERLRDGGGPLGSLVVAVALGGPYLVERGPELVLRDAKRLGQRGGVETPAARASVTATAGAADGSGVHGGDREVLADVDLGFGAVGLADVR